MCWLRPAGCARAAAHALLLRLLEQPLVERDMPVQPVFVDVEPQERSGHDAAPAPSLIEETPRRRPPAIARVRALRAWASPRSLRRAPRLAYGRLAHSAPLCTACVVPRTSRRRPSVARRRAASAPSALLVTMKFRPPPSLAVGSGAAGSVAGSARLRLLAIRAQRYVAPNGRVNDRTGIGNLPGDRRLRCGQEVRDRPHLLPILSRSEGDATAVRMEA